MTDTDPVPVSDDLIDQFTGDHQDNANGLVSGKKVSVYTKYYLSEYIMQVEKYLREMGVTISRENITGKIIEKLTINKIEGKSCNNGSMLSEVLGSEEIIAQEFLNKRRRFYRINTIDPEKERIKKEHEEFLASLSRKERLGYKLNKWKKAVDPRSYNFRGDLLLKSVNIKWLINSIFIIHILIAVFTGYSAVFYFRNTMDALSGMSYYLQRIVENYTYYVNGRVDFWLGMEYTILGYGIVTALLFRMDVIKRHSSSYIRSKRIRNLFILPLSYYFTGSFYFILGSLYTYNGDTLIHAPYSYVRNNVLILFISHIIVYLLQRKYMRLDNPVAISLGKENSFLTSISMLFYKMLNVPIQLAQYVIAVVVLFFTSINGMELYRVLSRRYISLNSGIVDDDFSFLVSFYSSILVLTLLFLTFKLENGIKEKVRKHNRRVLYLQLLAGLIYHSYILIITYFSEAANQFIFITFRYALTFTLLYLGTHLVLIFINGKMMKNSLQVKKAGIFKRMLSRSGTSSDKVDNK